MKTNTLLTLALLLSSSFGVMAEKSGAENLVTEGDFELAGDGFFAGWSSGGFLGGKPGTGGRWDNEITAENDADGTPFARLRCSDPEGTDIGISQVEPVVINPQWTELNLSAEMRVENYQKKAEWGGRAQVTVNFLDESSQPIAGEHFVGLTRDTDDWEPVAETFAIPPGAASVKVSAQLIGANGTLDIRKISLVAE